MQSVTNSQSFNRYTYCLNNPLKYTDPTGYTWLSHFGNWISKPENFVPILISVAGAAVGMPMLGAFYAGVTSQTLRGNYDVGSVAMAGASGILTSSVGFGTGALAGTVLPSVWNISSGTSAFLWGAAGGAASGGLTGGAMSYISGGSFSDGFISGAINGGIMGGIGGLMSYNSYQAELAARVQARNYSNISNLVGAHFKNATYAYLHSFINTNLKDMYIAAGRPHMYIDYSNVNTNQTDNPGTTLPHYIENTSDIYINPSAFANDDLLYMTVGHELVHGIDCFDNTSYEEMIRYTQEGARNLSEQRAYLWMMRNSRNLDYFNNAIQQLEKYPIPRGYNGIPPFHYPLKIYDK